MRVHGILGDKTGGTDRPVLVRMGGKETELQRGTREIAGDVEPVLYPVMVAVT